MIRTQDPLDHAATRTFDSHGQVETLTEPNGRAYPSRLIAHWTFNGDNRDISVVDAEQPVTLYETSYVAGQDGFGEALNLDSPGAYISTGGAVDLGGPSDGDGWTISAWVQGPLPTNGGAAHTLVYNTGGDRAIMLDSTLNLGTQVDGVFYSSGFNVVGHLSSGWHHIAAGGIGGSTYFYLDGEYVGRGAARTTAPILQLGALAGGGERFADAIDDVRVYDVQLAVETVEQLAAMTGDYTTFYERNDAGQIISAKTGDIYDGQVAQSTYQYDDRGNLLSTVDPTGLETRFEYDLLGRITSTTLVNPDAEGADDFNRSDTSSLGSDWGESIGDWEISGGRLQLADNPPSTAELLWTESPESTFYTVEAQVQSSGYGAARPGLWAAYQGPGDYHIVELQNNGPSQTVNLSTWKNGAAQMQSSATVDAPAGEWHLLSLSVYGSRLVVRVNGLEVINVEHPTFETPGQVGLSVNGPTKTSAIFDDLQLSESPTTRTTYNEAGDVEAILDPMGSRSANTYDLKRRVVESSAADGSVVSMAYDAAGNRVAVTDTLGRTTQFVYDERNRPIQTRLADGARTTIRYDANGNTVWAMDLLGYATEFTFDAADRPLTTTDAVGETSTGRYDALGRLTSSEDRLGYVTLFEYDDTNRLVETRYPLDGQFDGAGEFVNTTAYYAISTTDYNANGNVINQTEYDLADLAASEIPDDPRALTSARRRSTLTRYDGVGRATQWTDAAGASQLADYDLAGRVVSTIDQLGNETNFVYDALGRQILTLGPWVEIPATLESPWQNPTNLYDVNDDGIVSPIDALRIATELYSREYSDPISERLVDPAPGVPPSYFDVNADGFADAVDFYSVVAAFDSLPPPEEFGQTRPKTQTFYNAAGAVTSVVDAEGRLTQFEYDARGRLVTTIDAEGGVSRDVYDVADQLVVAEDALGQATVLNYDRRGRRVREIAPDPDGAGFLPPPVSHFEFDAGGNLVRQSDPLGHVTAFQYDELGRQTELIERAEDAHVLDFSTVSIEPYGESSGSGIQQDNQSGLGSSYEVLGGGATLRLFGNAWKKIDLSTEVTADTVVEFDFRSMSEGEIHAIGFDNDNVLDPQKSFQVWGTQEWGIDEGIETYLGDGWKHYRLQVGDFEDFVSGPATHLTLIADDDAAGAAENFFRNVTIYNDGEVGVTTLSYDAEGRLTGQTDALGRSTEWTYDGLGRVVRTSLPDSDGPKADDFNRANSTSVGAEWDEAIGDWEVSGNRLQLNDSPSATAMILQSEPLESSVYTVEAVVQSSGYSAAQPGLWAAYQGPGNYHLVELRSSGADQIVNLSTWQNGSSQIQSSAMVDAPAGEEHHLSLTVAGATLVVRLNGKEVLRVDHPTFDAPGQVGLSVNGPTKTAATFDDFQLTELSATTNVYDTVGNLTRVEDHQGRATEFLYDAVGRQVAELAANPDGAEADDFNRASSTSLGANWNESIGDWEISGNRLQLNDSPPLAANALWSDPPILMSYTVEAVVQSSDYVAARPGLLAAYQGSGNYHLVELSENLPNQTVNLSTWQNGIFQIQNSATVDAPAGEEHHLSLTVVGATLIVRLNGKEVLRADHPTFDAPGQVGFSVNGPTKTAASFDDFRLTDYHTSGISYDAAGNLLTAANLSDPRSVVTQYVYDPLGRRTQEILDFGGADPLTADTTTEFHYDRLGQFVAVVDANGQTTTFDYDSLGRQIRETLPDPDGPTIIGPVPPGSPDGSMPSPVTEFEYDVAGNLIAEKVIYADGEFGWDPFSQSYLTTTFTYDALGRLLSTTEPNGDTTTWVYDADDNLIALTDGAGNTTEYVYDALNRQIASRIDGVGGRDDFEQTDPDPKWMDTIGDWEINGGLLQVADNPTSTAQALWSDAPLSSNYTVEAVVYSTDYGAARPGLWAAYQGPGDYHIVELRDSGPNQTVNLSTWQNGSALMQSSTTVDAPAGEEHHLSLTVSGATLIVRLNGEEVLNVVHPTFSEHGRAGVSINGAIKTSATFDNFRLTNPLEDQTVYDVVGNPIQTTDRNGRAREFSYDNLDRIVQERWLDPLDGTTVVHAIDWSYDALGRLVEQGDAGATYRYQYDALDRVTEFGRDDIAQAADASFTYRYGPARLVDEIEANFGGADTRTFVYDNLDRVTRIEQDFSALGSDKRVDFSYDPLGALETVTRYADLPGLDEVATSTYDYDFAGRLIELTHTDPAQTVLADYGYSFDTAGRITAIDGLDRLYEYDDSGQLTVVTDNPSGGPSTDLETYTYDSDGNRTTADGATIATAADNRLADDGVYQYEYDLEGNLVRRIEIATGGFTEYQWDHRNRLTRVEEYKAAAAYDFSQLTVLPFDYQDGQNGSPTSAELLDGGATLHLEGNAWKAVALPVPYTLTPDTVLSFDFSSPAQGEIHGIGLDTNLLYDSATPNRTFQLYGTADYALQNYHDYTPSPNGVHYDIPVGQFLSGAFSYLLFVNDHDVANPTAEGFFSNVTLSEPNGLAVVSVIDYTYDVLDQLLTKAVDSDADGQIDRAERYVYEGGQLQMVYDQLALDALPLGASPDSAVRNRYLYGPAVDQVLADEQFFDRHDTFWTLADHQGTVHDLVAKHYDTGETHVRKHTDYDAFGGILDEDYYDGHGNTLIDPDPLTNLDAANFRFGFTGRDWDADVDLYFYRARWYDAATGRFVNQDPAEADVNAYRYVHNMPTLLVDPSGLVLQTPTQNLGRSGLNDGTVNPADQTNLISETIRARQQLSGSGIVRCIACHNPIIMHGGSVSDLPLSYQLGAMRWTKTETPEAADRAIALQRTAHRFTRRAVAEVGLFALTGGLGNVGLAGRTGYSLWAARGLNAGVNGAKFGLISETVGYPLDGEVPSATRFAVKSGIVAGLDFGLGAALARPATSAVAGSSEAILTLEGKVFLNRALYDFSTPIAAESPLIIRNGLVGFTKAASNQLTRSLATYQAFQSHSRVIELPVETSSEVFWKNGWRTADGKFASPQGPGFPGAAAQSAVWDAVEAKPGWQAIRGNVSVRDAAGQLRVYDGAARTPSGRLIGLEVKSGSGRLTQGQRIFDSVLNSSGTNTVSGVGRSSGNQIRRALEIRR